MATSTRPSLPERGDARRPDKKHGQPDHTPAELSRSWEGTFEELAAVVDTG